MGNHQIRFGENSKKILVLSVKGFKATTLVATYNNLFTNKYKHQKQKIMQAPLIYEHIRISLSCCLPYRVRVRGSHIPLGFARATPTFMPQQHPGLIPSNFATKSVPYPEKLKDTQKNIGTSYHSDLKPH